MSSSPSSPSFSSYPSHADFAAFLSALKAADEEGVRRHLPLLQDHLATQPAVTAYKILSASLHSCDLTMLRLVNEHLTDDQVADMRASLATLGQTIVAQNALQTLLSHATNMDTIRYLFEVVLPRFQPSLTTVSAQDPPMIQTYMLVTLVRTGRLDILRYLHTVREFPVVHQEVEAATEYGNLKVLQLLHEELGAPLTLDVFKSLLMSRHFRFSYETTNTELESIVDYLISHDCPIHADLVIMCWLYQKPAALRRLLANTPLDTLIRQHTPRRGDEWPPAVWAFLEACRSR